MGTAASVVQDQSGQVMSLNAGPDDAVRLTGNVANNVNNLAQNGSHMIPQGMDSTIAGGINSSIDTGSGLVNQGGQTVGSALEALMDKVPSDMKEMAEILFHTCTDKLNPEALISAANNAALAISPAIVGGGVLACIGGALNTAGGLAPEITAATSAFLIAMGPHLPVIGIAAGVLGAILITFQISRENDENVKTVMVWSASVKDWLVLIAEKVTHSGAESSMPLFEALKERLLAMVEEFEKYQKQWRITKMLSSTTFQRRFEMARTGVLDLKAALRDYLDQESQDRQEQMLQSVGEMQLQISEQLEGIDSKLDDLKDLILQTHLTALESGNGDSGSRDDQAPVVHQGSHVGIVPAAAPPAVAVVDPALQLVEEERLRRTREREYQLNSGPHKECGICFEPLYLYPAAVMCRTATGEKSCDHIIHHQCISDLAPPGQCPVCEQTFDISRVIPSPRSDPVGWFQAIDTNHNNYLTFQEISRALKAQLPLSQTQIENDADVRWGSWDKTKSGTVSLEEFLNDKGGLVKYLETYYPDPSSLTVAAAVAQQRNQPPDIRKDKEGWYRYFDRDGSLSMDKHEMTRALFKTFKVLHFDRSGIREMIDAVWPLFDIDQTGVIRMHEFIAPNNFADTIIAQLQFTKRSNSVANMPNITTSTGAQDAMQLSPIPIAVATPI